LGGIRRDETRARTWVTAFAATLLVHVLVIGAIVAMAPFSPTSLADAAPDPIQLVFAPPPAPSSDPTTFTELPENRADEPPEHADFLSNVDSRARDRSDHAADDALPQSDGLAEIAQVEIPDGAPEAARPPSREITDDPRERPADEPDAEAERARDASDPATRDAIAVAGDRPGKEVDSDVTPAAPAAPEPLEDEIVHPISQGDLRQASMSNPAGSVRLAGDISLNTTRWEWGEWMRQFRRDFMPRWLSPSGHLYGLIHGWTRVRVRIAPSGEMLDLVVIDEEGHHELRNASVRAFEAANPFPPLPDDFPEDSLVLDITLIYPDLRR